MARLDVYLMPGRSRRGYVLDVQANLLSHLKSRSVVPLIFADDAPSRIKDLNPVFEIDGTPCIMFTQAIATVPLKELARVVMSLDQHHNEINRALDILFAGY